MRSRRNRSEKAVWAPYRFWQVAWIALGAGSGLLIGVAWLVELLGGNRGAVAVLAFAWLVAWGVATWKLATFVCPKCGRRCNVDGSIAWYNVFRPRCVHCGHDRLDHWPSG